ncbi:hypothetical protein KIPB_010579, partial [Kipferlia bialata]|eukprot:g10579.t1
MEALALDLGIHDDLLTSLSQISNAGFHTRTGATGIRPSVSYSLDTSSLTGCVSLTFDTVVEDFVVFMYDATSTSAVVTQCEGVTASDNMMNLSGVPFQPEISYCTGTRDKWSNPCKDQAKCIEGGDRLSKSDFDANCDHSFYGTWTQCTGQESTVETLSIKATSETLMTDKARNFLISIRGRPSLGAVSKESASDAMYIRDSEWSRAANGKVYPPQPRNSRQAEAAVLTSVRGSGSVSIESDNLFGVYPSYDPSNSIGGIVETADLWLSQD